MKIYVVKWNADSANYDEHIEFFLRPETAIQFFKHKVNSFIDMYGGTSYDTDLDVDIHSDIFWDMRIDGLNTCFVKLICPKFYDEANDKE